MRALLALGLCCMTGAWAQPRVVFLGEQHTSAADHQAQLASLRALRAEGPVVVLAEMFTERSEAKLQAWNEGKDALTDDLWKAEWGFSRELYDPIWGWTREQKAPLLWLRPDPAFTKQVREGGPAAAVPRLGEVLVGPASYRDFMEEIAQGHGHGQVDETMVNRMFTVQCFWDEFMAWRVAEVAAEHPEAIVAVLVGDGHLREGEGVPWRLERRAPQLKVEVRRSGQGE